MIHASQWDNQITDEGVRDCVDSLKTNTCLTKLHWVSARKGMQGLWCACCGLSSHALQGKNQITDVGAKLLAELLESNNFLTELKLVSAGVAAGGTHTL